MNLWPHQEKALKEIREAVAKGHNRICVTAPTGAGKTRILCERIIESGIPTAVYTHRKMLLSQTEERLLGAGLAVGVRAAGREAWEIRDVQLAMIQSECSAIKRGRRTVHQCEEAFFDEAHQNKESQALSLIEAHDGVPIIGLTATPIGIGHIYDHLIEAGTNSELRKCGAHVPAIHKAPDEPDTKLVGKVKIDGGECGIAQKWRAKYAHRVFGRVIEHYKKYNPDGKPTLLFAPGVKESIWFAKELTKHGIPSAHIDGSKVWINGETLDNTDELREEIAHGSETGKFQIVSNRFCLREGVDWPWIAHGILATVFGSLTAYLQAGGRMLRAHPSMDHVIIQDHGGNWWRHGSLNTDRCWDLDKCDRVVSGERIESIREKKEPEPIVCPACNGVRLSGAVCPCGFKYDKKGRPVLQADGTLKTRRISEFRERRRLSKSDEVERDWIGRVRGTMRSKKPGVSSRTFAQVEAAFARDHDWCYPPRELPMMPKKATDWFRSVSEVPRENLT